MATRVSNSLRESMQEVQHLSEYIYLFSLPLKCLILIQESRKYTSLGEDYHYAAKRSGNIFIFLFKVFDATVKNLKRFRVDKS